MAVVATVRLQIDGTFCGPASVGTISIIKLLVSHARLGLGDAKGYVDRAVFDGEEVEIPVVSVDAAQRLVIAASALPAIPRIRTSILVGPNLTLAASASELLLRLVTELDQQELQIQRGLVDEFPPGSVSITFVAPHDDNEGGQCLAEHSLVEVYRKGSRAMPARAAVDAASSPCPSDELAWLVHELGHHESKLAGFVPTTKDSAPALRYEEELRAWAFAERRLRQLAFGDLSRFQELRHVGLASYRKGLPVSDEVAAALALRVEAWLTEAA